MIHEKVKLSMEWNNERMCNLIQSFKLFLSMFLSHSITFFSPVKMKKTEVVTFYPEIDKDFATLFKVIGYFPYSKCWALRMLFCLYSFGIIGSLIFVIVIVFQATKGDATLIGFITLMGLRFGKKNLRNL